MTRAVNIKAERTHVETMCAKHNAVITAIESLRSGGTRVVLSTGDSAAIIRRAYGTKVLDGPVQREPTRLMHARS